MKRAESPRFGRNPGPVLVEYPAGPAQKAGADWNGLRASPAPLDGAVVNNAGAFGSDIAANLVLAEILHPLGDKIQRSEWSVDQFGYEYRTSVIKSGEKSGDRAQRHFRAGTQHSGKGEGNDLRYCRVNASLHNPEGPAWAVCSRTRPEIFLAA